MHFKLHLLLYTHLLLIHHSNAFNITRTLNHYPSFSTFNQYLSQTNLASEINSRKRITVFAVPNNAISRLSDKPHDVLEKILKVHVVLDYYNVEKLRNVANHTGHMTTLFQTTGRAIGQQGFLKTTLFKKNIFIGSATQGSGLGAILVRSIACEPCNLSVLYISTAIVPDGISGSNYPVESPVQPPAYGPRTAPSPANSAITGAPPPPVLKKPPPPSLNPSLAAPSESPADAPEYSGESSPKRKSTPASSPPNSGCRESSDFEIGLYVVLTVSLSTIYRQ